MATREAAEALAPAFDVVVVETVGVGQSETDVEDVCDPVAVVVQPGSGDVLQFLKAGIMEVPDLLVVTKADLGDVATRSRRDLTQALAASDPRRCPCWRCRRCPRRPGSASWRTPSRRIATERTWPSAACAPAAGRPEGFRPSTASARCATWAAAARPSGCSSGRTRPQA